MTLGLAPLRPSHVASSRNAVARRRRPVRPLECAHCTSPIGQSVAGKKGDSRHADSAGSTDVVPASVTVPPLETRVQAIQLSPYRAGVAGQSRTRLQAVPALHPCSCPVLLSDSGKVFASKSYALNFDHLRWQFTRCTTRRTLSWHTTPQRCALCHQASVRLMKSAFETRDLRFRAFPLRDITPSRRSAGSSAYQALLPPITYTSPSSRQHIPGITPGLGFLRNPSPYALRLAPTPISVGEHV